MHITDILQQFLKDIQLTLWQEWLSFITQIASVWLATRNNIWVYPIGIIGVLLAAWLYLVIAQPPLYADGVLNGYYFVMSVWGWYNWSKGETAETSYPISWCAAGEWIAGLLGFLLGWASIYTMLIYLTDSNTPILDALVSASAVLAMWWMAQRKIENWWAWIASNIVAIPLNFYKGFMLFTVMYVIFLGLAWIGYRQWRVMIEVESQKLS